MTLLKLRQYLRGTVGRRVSTVAILILPLLALPVIARGETVTLSTGTASVQVPPGQISISLNGTQGGAFSLHYFNSEYAGPLVSSFGFQSVTQGIGSVSYNGTTFQFLTGNLSFTNSVVTGQVSGYQTLNDAVNNNPAFVVTFGGTGFLNSVPGNRTFTVTAPTPEPASLILLTTGLGAVAAGIRRRKKKAIEPRATGASDTVPN